MPDPKKTGEEMVDAILNAPYDPIYLAAYFASFLGAVVDGRLQTPIKGEAKRMLERLSDADQFLAETPAARKAGA